MQPRVRNALIFLLTLGLLGVFLRSVNVDERLGRNSAGQPVASGAGAGLYRA